VKTELRNSYDQYVSLYDRKEFITNEDCNTTRKETTQMQDAVFLGRQSSGYPNC
jgi:hypothetical protein